MKQALLALLLVLSFFLTMSQAHSKTESENSLNIIRCYRQSRELVFNYALFAAILGLNPFPNLLLITIAITGIVALKMIRDVGAQWNFQQGQDFLAIVGSLFGLLGAFATAFMAWVTVIVISIWIPLVNRFAISAALCTWMWMTGRTANQYYLNGCEGYK
jgi:uncharacterized protein (DUF697 family)